MPEYTVVQGDCLSSIAAGYGMQWQTIWNHPDNAALAAERKDPNVLYPGDVLFIPDKDNRTEAKGTDSSHSFVLKCATTYLRLQILDWDQPRGGELYRLDVEGLSLSGVTDGSGYLEEAIPATAASARLFLGAVMEQIEIDLGTLDPVTEASGKMGRLNNLGYACRTDGTIDDRAKEAIILFQTDMNLPANGQLDASTGQMIQQLHGR